MRAGAAGAALAALFLAACDGGGGEPAPVRKIEIDNPHHRQLQALSPPMQRLGLMRAVRDSGKRCKKVQGAAFQEVHRGLAMWVADCSDTGAWAVFLAPTGDLQVRDCDQAEQLELPQCRVPPPAAGEDPLIG